MAIEVGCLVRPVFQLYLVISSEISENFCFLEVEVKRILVEDVNCEVSASFRDFVRLEKNYGNFLCVLRVGFYLIWFAFQSNVR